MPFYKLENFGAGRSENSTPFIWFHDETENYNDKYEIVWQFIRL